MQDPGPPATAIHRFAQFELRAHRGLLLENGTPVAVEPKVLAVLAYLLRHHHRPVPKEELLDQIWPGVAVGDSVVHRCISRARRVLGGTDKNRPFIITRGHRGYQFAAEVCSALVTEPTHSTGSAIPHGDQAPATERCRPRVSETRELLVGRSDELRRLHTAIDGLCDKRGSTISIAGEPGIGKSMLLAEMASYGDSRGLRILHGRGSEVAGAPAFWPWIQLIRQLTNDDEGRRLIEQLGPAASDIAQVVPEIADLTGDQEPISGLAPDQQRFRFFDSVVRLFTRAAARRPSLVIIDDLHRCDDGSLLLWQLLAEAAVSAPLTLACSYRSHELHSHGLLAEVLASMWQGDRSTRINLAGLAAPEVDMLLSHVLGKAATHEVSAHVRERSLGNPFFVIEFANQLRAISDDADTDGNRIGGIPRSIRALLSMRADTAGPSCRAVLERAAVIGRRFNVTLLRAACQSRVAKLTAANQAGAEALDQAGAEALDQAGAEALDQAGAEALDQAGAEALDQAGAEALDRAVAAELVETIDGEPGGYMFRHVLIRDVLYDALDQRERSASHRAIAEFIIDEYAGSLADHYDVLAHHYLAAAADGYPDRAREFCVLAAERANERLSYEEAANCYDNALAALELEREVCDQQRCELLIQAADSRNRAGNVVGARATFEKAVVLARHLEDPSLFMRSAIGIAVRFGQPVDFGGVDDSVVELLEEALCRLPEAATSRRAIVLACLSFALYASPQRERARAYSRDSERTARASGDHYALSVALFAKQMMSTYPGDTTSTEAITDELIAVSESSGLDEMVLLGRTFRVFRCLESGSGSDELDAAIASRTQLARRLRQPQGLWWIHVIDAARALMQGDVVSGDQESRRAHELGRRSANSNQAMTYETQQGLVLMHRGDFTGLFELSARMAEMYPDIHASQVGHMTLLARGGSVDEPRRFAAAWCERDLRGCLQPHNWLFEAACLAELGLLLGDRALCENTYAFLLPHADKSVIVGKAIGYYGPVARYLAALASLLHSHDAAREHFELAVERARAFDALPWIASSQTAYARCLLRQGTATSAREAKILLEQALDIAKRFDHAGLEAEIAAATA